MALNPPPPYTESVSRISDIDTKIQYHFQWIDDREGPFSDYFLPDDTIRDVKERLCERLPDHQWTDLNLAVGGTRAYLNNKDTLESCNIGPFSRVVITSTRPTPNTQEPNTQLPNGQALSSGAAGFAQRAVDQPPPGHFQIFVVTLEGRSIAIWVSDESTVGDLKTEVQKVTGVASDHQRLLYAGKQLEGIQTKLRVYNVQKHCNINLVGRLKGGIKIVGPNILV